MINQTKDLVTTKNIKMKNIINKLNNNELKPYEPFFISAYLSSTACLDIPETYIDEIRKYTGNVTYLYENNKFNRAVNMVVEPNDLPQCQVNIGKNNYIAYIYIDKEKRFKAEKDKNGKAILNSFQQFIPVILDAEMYYKYVDNYVHLKCCAVPLEQFFDKEDLVIDQDDYSYLNECFYDIYQPYITSFFLKGLDASLDETRKKDVKIDDIDKIQFIVEYEIISYISSKGLIEKIKNFIQKKKYSSFPNVFKFENGKILFISNNDISISAKGHKVGFYKKINISNSETYKKEIKELEIFIKNFFRKNKMSANISFISDYRREKIFDITMQKK